MVPERTAALNATREIESLRTIDLHREREKLIRAREEFRKFGLIALLGLVALVLTVAFVTSLRLRSLERRAQSLQLQTEQDREKLRGICRFKCPRPWRMSVDQFRGSCTIKSASC